MSNESSLKELFATASSKRRTLIEGPLKRASAEFNELTNQVVDLLVQCLRLVDSAAIFSTNELLEDLATGDLKYLALDYLLASTLESAGEGVVSRISSRSALVDQAIAYYVSFIKKLDDYHILPTRLSSRIQDASSSSDGSFKISNLEAKDAASRRAEKIELFKLEKSLDTRLKARSNDGGSDEALREAEISQLGLYALKSLSSLTTLDMERTLLKNRPPKDVLDAIEKERLANDPTEQRRKASPSSAADKFTNRVEQLPQQKPILAANGKVNRPFTIVSSRDDVRKNVFGTGQTLPTMTVDEYLQEEIKRGGIIQGGGAASKTDPEDAKADEDDEAKADAETYKMRDWDEFTDANPRGSGNRMNMG